MPVIINNFEIEVEPPSQAQEPTAEAVRTPQSETDATRGLKTLDIRDALRYQTARDLRVWAH